jgi:hypothetical protein
MSLAMRSRGPALVAVLLTGFACRPSPPPAAPGATPDMTTPLDADLAVARKGRIFFSHHSVGRNVLAGIQSLDARAGGERLQVVDLDEALMRPGPLLAHASGGRNQDPKSKIDYFAATLRGTSALAPDLAFMKLCYVDFEPRTDVEGLFAHYRSTLEALKREHPRIRFAHVTVPLMESPSDLKSSLRRLLGREVWEDASNARRTEFNQRLVEAFGADPVFDLARAETIGPDGSSVTRSQGQGQVPSLHPAWSEDGGHLNAAGQQVAGAAAIRFLGSALRDGVAPQ